MGSHIGTVRQSQANFSQVPTDSLNMADVDLEDLLQALSAEELANLVDEMAADPDDKHMPASVRTAYRCEKEPTGDLNRDSLINCINEIALNTPDQEEKVKYEPGMKRGKEFVPKYNEEQMEKMAKEESGTVRLEPEMEEALMNATLNDIMELADILNTNPQDFVMEAYADPLQYFEPDPPNDTNPQEVLDKLSKNDSDLNDVNGISEQLFCDIFNALKNNDRVVKFSACNTDLSDFAVATLCSVLDQNSSIKSLSIENNRVTPDCLADLFESIASPNNGLVEVRCCAQAQQALGLRVEERIANAICKNPRLMKAGINLEFQDIVLKVSRQMISNMDKIRTNRLKDGVAPGAGVKWTAARTLD